MDSPEMMLSTSQPAQDGGSLSLVATPIGNLEDITFRALNQLRNSDAILCEDTRVTKRLLSRYNIHTALIIFHDHNEKKTIPWLIEQMKHGKKFSLVSDAGTPVFSDPGYTLIRASREAGIPVTALPGCNAAVTALILSGLPPAPFIFMGFPPRGHEERLRSFRILSASEKTGLSTTIAWYESPHRIMDTLKDLIQVFGKQRLGAITRELTKYYEEVITGELEKLESHFKEHAPRGEFVILIGADGDKTTTQEEDDNSIIEHLETALKEHSLKDSVTLVAGTLNLPKRMIYQKALDLTKNK